MSTQGNFPGEGMSLTHILVVKDIRKSREFYENVLGASLYGEYGGTSVVFSFAGAWLLIVTGGDPTEDKPDVTYSAPDSPQTVSHSMTIRVPDCQESYEILKSRGAKFLTEPVNWGYEIRAFFRDPDGHLLEISQVDNIR